MTNCERSEQSLIILLYLGLRNWPEQTNQILLPSRRKSSIVISLLVPSILAHFLPMCTYE